MNQSTAWDSHYSENETTFKDDVSLVLKKLRKEGALKGFVYDVGCGVGDLVASLRREGINAFGVDVSAVGIEAAKKRHSSIKEYFSVGDLSVVGEKANCIIMNRVLAFLGHIDTVLIEIANRLDDDGLLVVASDVTNDSNRNSVLKPRITIEEDDLKSFINYFKTVDIEYIRTDTFGDTYVIVASSPRR